jgi:transcriptional regulator with XRE-family HTH domain
MAKADDSAERSALGQFIKSQRQLAELSQRELARLANLSDPYVSQIERGRHDPSIKVLKAIAKALNIRADTILSYAGWLQGEHDAEADPVDAEPAIRADHRLTRSQQDALVQTYRAFLASNDR